MAVGPLAVASATPGLTDPLVQGAVHPHDAAHRAAAQAFQQLRDSLMATGRHLPDELVSAVMGALFSAALAMSAPLASSVQPHPPARLHSTLQRVAVAQTARKAAPTDPELARRLSDGLSSGRYPDLLATRAALHKSPYFSPTPSATPAQPMLPTTVLPQSGPPSGTDPRLLKDDQLAAFAMGGAGQRDRPGVDEIADLAKVLKRCDELIPLTRKEALKQKTISSLDTLWLGAVRWYCRERLGGMTRADAQVAALCGTMCGRGHKSSAHTARHSARVWGIGRLRRHYRALLQFGELGHVRSGGDRSPVSAKLAEHMAEIEAWLNVQPVGGCNQRLWQSISTSRTLRGRHA